MPSHQIICLKCAEVKPGDHPGEWWHREQGKARGFENGDFVCDHCNKTIPKGTECVAQSLGLDRTPYEPWESDYIGEEAGVVDGTIKVVDLEDGTVEEFPPHRDLWKDPPK